MNTAPSHDSDATRGATRGDARPAARPLDAGTTPVDDLIEELGHEPNGYFWEGVARWLVTTDTPALDGRFSYDPEAGMFCAHGPDRNALAALGEAISAVATDPDRMRQLIAAAHAAGFEFDD